MLWAKLWTDILGDPKLMRAARKGARNLNLTPWLMVFAKQANDNGRISVGSSPAEPMDVSSKIPGCKPREVAVCCIHLAEIGVMTRDADGAYRFTNWHRRQGLAPSDAPSSVAERVRRHRQKKRESNALQVVTRNGTEIEQEKEIEQEQEKEAEAAALHADRKLLLDILSPTQRKAMTASLAIWAEGYDLPNDVPKRRPTDAEIDQACREVAGSVAAGLIRVRTVRAYLGEVMRGVPHTAVVANGQRSPNDRFMEPHPDDAL